MAGPCRDREPLGECGERRGRDLACESSFDRDREADQFVRSEEKWLGADFCFVNRDSEQLLQSFGACKLHWVATRGG